MANWIKLTEDCFYKRVNYEKKGGLNFQDINTIAMQKLGAVRKGIRPVAVKFSFYQPLHEFEEYSIEETCLVIIPKRSGMSISVASGKEDKFTKIPGADYYNRVLAVRKGAVLRMKTRRSDTSFNNLIFMYNEDFVRARITREDN